MRGATAMIRGAAILHRMDSKEPCSMGLRAYNPIKLVEQEFDVLNESLAANLADTGNAS